MACSIYGCPKYTRNATENVLYPFPIDDTMRDQWSFLAGRKYKYKYHDQRTRVCSRHFHAPPRPTDVPTLYLPPPGERRSKYQEEVVLRRRIPEARLAAFAKDLLLFPQLLDTANVLAYKVSPSGVTYTKLWLLKQWRKLVRPHVWSEPAVERARRRPPACGLRLADDMLHLVDYIMHKDHLSHYSDLLDEISASVPNGKCAEIAEKYGVDQIRVQTVWDLFSSGVRMKLQWLTCVGDRWDKLPRAALLSPSEWANSGTVIMELEHVEWAVVYTAPLARPVQLLLVLAATYNLEDRTAPSELRQRRWATAYRGYNNSGLRCPFVLLQRRWQQLKQDARRAARRPHERRAHRHHWDLLTRWPHVATEPLPTWRELREQGFVYELTEDQLEKLQDVEPEHVGVNEDFRGLLKNSTVRWPQIRVNSYTAEPTLNMNSMNPLQISDVIEHLKGLNTQLKDTRQHLYRLNILDRETRMTIDLTHSEQEPISLENAKTSDDMDTIVDLQSLDPSKVKTTIVFESDEDTRSPYDNNSDIEEQTESNRQKDDDDILDIEVRYPLQVFKRAKLEDDCIQNDTGIVITNIRSELSVEKVQDDINMSKNSEVVKKEKDSDIDVPVPKSRELNSDKVKDDISMSNNKEVVKKEKDIDIDVPVPKNSELNGDKVKDDISMSKNSDVVKKERDGDIDVPVPKNSQLDGDKVTDDISMSKNSDVVKKEKDSDIDVSLLTSRKRIMFEDSSDASGSDADSECSNDDVEVDDKLLMDTKVILERIDSKKNLQIFNSYHKTSTEQPKPVEEPNNQSIAIQYLKTKIISDILSEPLVEKSLEPSEPIKSIFKQDPMDIGTNEDITVPVPTVTRIPLDKKSLEPTKPVKSMFEPGPMDIGTNEDITQPIQTVTSPILLAEKTLEPTEPIKSIFKTESMDISTNEDITQPIQTVTSPILLAEKSLEPSEPMKSIFEPDSMDIDTNEDITGPIQTVTRIRLAEKSLEPTEPVKSMFETMDIGTNEDITVPVETVTRIPLDKKSLEPTKPVKSIFEPDSMDIGTNEDITQPIQTVTRIPLAEKSLEPTEPIKSIFKTESMDNVTNADITQPIQTVASPIRKPLAVKSLEPSEPMKSIFKQDPMDIGTNEDITQPIQTVTRMPLAEKSLEPTEPIKSIFKTEPMDNATNEVITEPIRTVISPIRIESDSDSDDLEIFIIGTSNLKPKTVNELETADSQISHESKDVETSKLCDTRSEKNHPPSESNELSSEDEPLIYKSKRRTYENQQASSENQQIPSENQPLLSERKQMSSENQQLLSERKQMSSENQQLLSERKQLSSENQKLLLERKQMSSESIELQSANEQFPYEHNRTSSGNKPPSETSPSPSESGHCPGAASGVSGTTEELLKLCRPLSIVLHKLTPQEYAKTWAWASSRPVTLPTRGLARLLPVAQVRPTPARGRDGDDDDTSKGLCSVKELHDLIQDELRAREAGWTCCSARAALEYSPSSKRKTSAYQRHVYSHKQPRCECCCGWLLRDSAPHPAALLYKRGRLTAALSAVTKKPEDDIVAKFPLFNAATFASSGDESDEELVEKAKKNKEPSSNSNRSKRKRTKKTEDVTLESNEDRVTSGDADYDEWLRQRNQFKKYFFIKSMVGKSKVKNQETVEAEPVVTTIPNNVPEPLTQPTTSQSNITPKQCDVRIAPAPNKPIPDPLLMIADMIEKKYRDGEQSKKLEGVLQIAWQPTGNTPQDMVETVVPLRVTPLTVAPLTVENLAVHTQIQSLNAAGPSNTKLNPKISSIEIKQVAPLTVENLAAHTQLQSLNAAGPSNTKLNPKISSIEIKQLNLYKQNIQTRHLHGLAPMKTNPQNKSLLKTVNIQNNAIPNTTNIQNSAIQNTTNIQNNTIPNTTNILNNAIPSTSQNFKPNHILTKRRLDAVASPLQPVFNINQGLSSRYPATYSLLKSNNPAAKANKHLKKAVIMPPLVPIQKTTANNQGGKQYLVLRTSHSHLNPNNKNVPDDGNLPLVLQNYNVDRHTLVPAEINLENQVSPSTSEPNKVAEVVKRITSTVNQQKRIINTVNQRLRFANTVNQQHHITGSVNPQQHIANTVNQQQYIKNKINQQNACSKDRNLKSIHITSDSQGNKSNRIEIDGNAPRDKDIFVQIPTTSENQTRPLFIKVNQSNLSEVQNYFLMSPDNNISDTPQNTKSSSANNNEININQYKFKQHVVLRMTHNNVTTDNNSDINERTATADHDSNINESIQDTTDLVDARNNPRILKRVSNPFVSNIVDKVGSVSVLTCGVDFEDAESEPNPSDPNLEFSENSEAFEDGRDSPDVVVLPQEEPEVVDLTEDDDVTKGLESIQIKDKCGNYTVLQSMPDLESGEIMNSRLQSGGMPILESEEIVHSGLQSGGTYTFA